MSLVTPLQQHVIANHKSQLADFKNHSREGRDIA